MSARTPPQTEAIEVEPFDSHTSLLMRMSIPVRCVRAGAIRSRAS